VTALTLLFAVAAYLVATGAFLAHVIFGKSALRRWAHAGLATGAALHLIALGSRVAVFGYQALAPLPEQLSLIALLAVSVYLGVALRAPLTAAGAVLAPLAFLASLSAYYFEQGPTPGPTGSGGFWLAIHVGHTLLGYAVFALSFCLSLAYLFQEHQLKSKARTGVFRRLPPLETLDQWNHRFVAWGFVFFTIGILSGSWLAQRAWGALWSWDPVQTWSGIAWLLYAGLLHARSVGWRGKRAAQLIVLSFLLLLASFIGVNTLLPGRHGIQTSWSHSS